MAKFKAAKMLSMVLAFSLVSIASASACSSWITITTQAGAKATCEKFKWEKVFKYETEIRGNDCRVCADNAIWHEIQCGGGPAKGQIMYAREFQENGGRRFEYRQYTTGITYVTSNSQEPWTWACK